jgi:hypothetical protein
MKDFLLIIMSMNVLSYDGKYFAALGRQSTPGRFGPGDKLASPNKKGLTFILYCDIIYIVKER